MICRGGIVAFTLRLARQKFSPLMPICDKLLRCSQRMGASAIRPALTESPPERLPGALLGVNVLVIKKDESIAERGSQATARGVAPAIFS